MDTKPVQIFDHVNFTIYLNKILEEKKIRNPRYSLRSWAKDLGITSPSQLSQYLSGSRKPTAEVELTLAKQLHLCKRGKRYLKTLIHFTHAKSESDKAFFKELLSEIKPTPLQPADNHIPMGLYSGKGQALRSNSAVKFNYGIEIDIKQESISIGYQYFKNYLGGLRYKIQLNLKNKNHDLIELYNGSHHAGYVRTLPNACHIFYSHSILGKPIRCTLHYNFLKNKAYGVGRNHTTKTTFQDELELELLSPNPAK